MHAQPTVDIDLASMGLIPFVDDVGELPYAVPGFRHGYSAASTGKTGAWRDRIDRTFAKRVYPWPPPGLNGHQIISDDWYEDHGYGPAWWDDPAEEHGLYVETGRLVIGEAAPLTRPKLWNYWSPGARATFAAQPSPVQEATKNFTPAQADAYFKVGTPPPEPSWLDSASEGAKAYYDEMSNDAKRAYATLPNPLARLEQNYKDGLARMDAFVAAVDEQLREWRNSLTAIAVVGMLSLVAIAGFVSFSGTGRAVAASTAVQAREMGKTSRVVAKETGRAVTGLL